ncbi:skeletal aspartic acid-rich protein 1-like [Montipora capricornis]|uniref:skeletal aspartic acid-rich protein 1-like n=1 Tax=Montipora capricornis TaxID=246305 RepID=UPI0035F16A2D
MIFLPLLCVFCRAVLTACIQDQLGQNNTSRQFDAVNGVVCKVVGFRTRIMCVHPNSRRPNIDFCDSNRDRVLIEFESFEERNKDGNLVGKANRKRHFFNSFPEEPFHFTAQSSSSYQGVRVKNINFTSTLNAKNASLKIMVYMFEDHGNITFGNETSEMREGMLKFNIEIRNWQFCAKHNSDEDCNVGDDGEFIDVALVIKSKGKPKQIPQGDRNKRRHPRCFKTIRYNKCPKEFDIGGGSEIVLSSQVMVDDEIRDMPGNGDFPKLKQADNKQKVILRFPKATNRIFYDPGLEVGEADAGTQNLPQLRLAVLLYTNILFMAFYFE